MKPVSLKRVFEWLGRLLSNETNAKDSAVTAGIHRGWTNPRVAAGLARAIEYAENRRLAGELIQTMLACPATERRDAYVQRHQRLQLALDRACLAELRCAHAALLGDSQRAVAHAAAAQALSEQHGRELDRMERIVDAEPGTWADEK